MNAASHAPHLSKEKGVVLLELARKTIAEKLNIDYESGIDLQSMSADSELQELRGTFVTLKISHQLRGCIGNLGPEKPLSDSVKDNALNAAFHDPRFSPLTQDEFRKIQIEVSVLTQPQKLEYSGAEDLLEKLEPNLDGLILRKGIHSSTFLPQVWDQLPDKKEFLQQLCLKAGLAPDEWKKGDLLVYTYRVQYFEEDLE